MKKASIPGPLRVLTIVLLAAVLAATIAYLNDNDDMADINETASEQQTETATAPQNATQNSRLGEICQQGFVIEENETGLTFEVTDDYAVMSGPLDTDVPDKIDALLRDHPDVQTIVMTYVPGSDDDDANAVAIRTVYQEELDICLPDNAEIASGGVDFFLAGRNRDIGDNTFIGVHSWADDANVEGGDLPVDDPQHQVYLDLFADINVDPEFYWFTLEAASADDIHNMTQAERDRFQLDNYEAATL